MERRIHQEHGAVLPKISRVVGEASIHSSGIYANAWVYNGYMLTDCLHALFLTWDIVANQQHLEMNI